MLARKLTVAVVLCAMGLSACGSSSKSAGSTPGTSASQGSSGDTSTTASTSDNSGGGGGGSFCDLMRKDASSFKGPDINATSPKDLKDLYANVVPEINKAQQEAPAAIKSDIGTLGTSLKSLVKALDDVGYDVTKLDLNSLKALADPKFAAASQNLTTYLEKHCGIKNG